MFWRGGSVPLLAPAVAVFATALLSGCGSTAPTQPSAVTPSVQSTAPPFASLVGWWGGTVSIALLYGNPFDPANPILDSSHCTLFGNVTEHTATTLVGSASFNGASLNSDKECGSGFSFSATMRRDGTFTSVQFTHVGLSSFECYPSTPPVFNNGSANGDGFRIMLVDQTTCRWPPLTFTNNVPTRGTERTFTVIAGFRHSSAVPPAP